jgi:hypothetical protein
MEVIQSLNLVVDYDSQILPYFRHRGAVPILPSVAPDYRLFIDYPSATHFHRHSALINISSPLYPPSDALAALITSITPSCISTGNIYTTAFHRK